MGGTGIWQSLKACGFPPGSVRSERGRVIGRGNKIRPIDAISLETALCGFDYYLLIIRNARGMHVCMSFQCAKAKHLLRSVKIVGFVAFVALLILATAKLPQRSYGKHAHRDGCIVENLPTYARLASGKIAQIKYIFSENRTLTHTHTHLSEASLPNNHHVVGFLLRTTR